MTPRRSNSLLGAWKPLLGDPLTLLGIAVLVVWTVATLPWVDAATRSFLTQRVFDPLGLVIPIVACTLAARATSASRERAFWLLVAGALAAWMTGMLPRLVGLTEQPGHAAAAALWTDFWYVGYYACMLTAASIHLGRRDSGPRVRLDSAGLVVLGAATVVYTVLVPANMAPTLYASGVSSFLLYLVLDVILLILFAGLVRRAEQPEWRRVHQALTVAAAGQVLFDALQGAWIAELLPAVPYGTPLDAAWQAPVTFILLAARLRSLEGPAEQSVSTVDADEPTNSFPGRLILYTVTLPTVHLFVYGTGFADPQLQRARTLVVLATLLLLQAMAVAESRRLVRRNRALRQAQVDAAVRMQQAHYWETVGRLAGGIAHEFNNLLTAILGHASLARGQLAANDPARSDLDVVDQAGQRATELVRQMLAFGRRQHFRPEPVELSPLISELCEDRFSGLLGDSIQLRCDLAPDLPPVHGDRQGLTDALTEVILNARDATPSGGTLVVSTGLDADGQWIVLSVRDSGRGMDTETRSRAFDPFFTTKEIGDGTGLGLASAAGTIEQLDGEIELHSEPGAGTEVLIRLQVAEVGERVNEEARRGRSTAAGSRSSL